MYSSYNPQISLSREDIISRSKIIFDESLTRLAEFSFIESMSLDEIETDKIWGKKIIGKQDVNISGLIKKLNNSDWVNQGRKYLLESICPFCQQNVPDDFKTQLEDFFDSEYESSINRISEFQTNYITLIKRLTDEISNLINIERNKQNSKLDIDEVFNIYESLQTCFRENNLLINNKIKEPSRTVDLSYSFSLIIKVNEILLNANEKIKANNDLFDNYETERRKLIQNIWALLISENIDIIKKFLAKKSGLEQGISEIIKKKDDLFIASKKLLNEIIEATKNVTSVQPSVDAINQTLASFGFDSFRIVASTKKKNHYQIQRDDGTIATETLSEGEITFITFLYFLERAKGGSSIDNITDNRVLVIDDPVSSLDSNVLFIVSSLIKEINDSIKSDTSNIKQIFILTHNVYFHKEVSFINGRNKEDRDTYYWILRKNSNRTSIQFYAKSNPVNTSYGLLWHELRRDDNISSVNIQNIMRRIIEDYFKILGGLKDDDLLAYFSDPYEKQVCKSLLSWVNDGSHCIPDDIYIDSYADSVVRYFRVFENIFRYSGNGPHFDMMMKTG